MLEKARNLAKQEYPHLHVEFKEADAENPPFKEETFDLVVCSCLLFLMPDPSNMLQEIKRVMKPGARLGLLNPSAHLNEERAKQLTAKWHLTEEESSALLQWARIAERRHRFEKLDMQKKLMDIGFRKIESTHALDEISLITIAAL